jgi:hypothetical protein
LTKCICVSAVIASVGAEIARAEQALKRYYEAFEQGRLSPERCDERLTRLQARLENLRAQQAELAPRRLTRPHVRRRRPISPSSPTRSSASSLTASRRRRRHSSGY